MRFLLLLIVFLLAAPQILATSQQAYQDYLFQTNEYRRTFSEFTIAKNEYEKFKSLSSQSNALEKTKSFLITRNAYLRSYLLLLIEKLIENQGIGDTSRALFISLLGREVAFLEGQAGRISLLNSLPDAEIESKALETHYPTLLLSIHQALTSILVGNLNSLAISFDQIFEAAQRFIVSQTDSIPGEKLATVNRWLLQIQNKRSLYQQKVDLINQINSQPTKEIRQLERQRIDIERHASEAKQFLSEGTSFLGDLIRVLKYEN